MSIWSDLEDRSAGVVTRKEDLNLSFLYSGTFKKEDLLDEAKAILSNIYGFKGFAPFLPSDILEEAGPVQVFLDDKETQKVPVTLKKLEDERDSLKKEVERLKKLVEGLVKLNVDQGEIEKLCERIRRLEGKIKDIEDLIKRMKHDGIDTIELEVKLLGYYEREKAEIHLMMGTISEKYGPKAKDIAIMTGITFVHELMHAYFDVRDPYAEHPHCRSIEEPIAEYGMLCFMEMFERLDSGYAGILNTAKGVVEEKKYSLGVCDYGFGRYLFDDKASFGVNWVSLFHSTCTSLLMNAPEVLDYGEMISPIRYPLHEFSCESKLYEVLKPRRFFYHMNKKAFIDYYIRTKKKDSRSYLKKDGDFRGEVELNKQLASNPGLFKVFHGVSSFFDINNPKDIQGLLDWVNKNKPLFGVKSGGTPDIATILRRYIDFLS